MFNLFVSSVMTSIIIQQKTVFHTRDDHGAYAAHACNLTMASSSSFGPKYQVFEYVKLQMDCRTP